MKKNRLTDNTQIHALIMRYKYDEAIRKVSQGIIHDYNICIPIGDTYSR